METSLKKSSEEPVRVLHLIDGLSWGGSQRWVWDIVRLSDPRHFTHRIVTINPDGGDYVYAERLEAAGVYQNVTESVMLRALRTGIYHDFVRHRLVPLRKLLSATWHLGCQASSIPRIIHSMRQFRPDVVHTHTFYGFTSGVLVKRIFGTPLIHSVPCLFSQMVDAGFSWMPGFYRRIHPRVDYFFTGASLEELRSVKVPPDKTGEIRGVVDQRAIDDALRTREHDYYAVRSMLGLDEKALIALSVGRLHPSKGHDLALEALPPLVERWPNLHWVLLGEGDQRPLLEARSKDLGMEKHVHMIGFRADPLPFYSAANVYVRSAIYEAENLCSYQAMAMGLPVVGFDTGCETELLRKVGHGLLVPNKDAAALAHAVSRILSMPEQGKELGCSGARFCRAHLGLSQSIEAFCSRYARLSGSPGLFKEESETELIA
ncbi:glycosyl transferase family 1 [Nitrospira sp. KM1]|uniref:glycosyltransferase n=1 Tax=Nitrospira sp. KM1 TaxID=1936990 RepID=UPI0013A78545|nr:glycosyltransferase [Nitrospira sp. KM1]BCA54211.1 glycosyl transferase family 1 [Nitrospira sp. KM1]